MDDFSTSGHARPRDRAVAGTSTLLGQVMFLVAVALGFMTAGAFIGQELSQGTALICFLAGFGMLLAQAFGGERFRVGAFAIGWLYVVALLFGLGIGPTIAYFLENDGTVITQAAGGTALIVLGMGAVGFTLSKDLASWMRPLTFINPRPRRRVVRAADLLQRRQPDHQRGDRDRLGAADHGRLQLPAKARHRERRGVAGDGHLRVDREHLPVVAEHLRRLSVAGRP